MTLFLKVFLFVTVLISVLVPVEASETTSTHAIQSIAVPKEEDILYCAQLSVLYRAADETELARKFADKAFSLKPTDKLRPFETILLYVLSVQQDRMNLQERLLPLAKAAVNRLQMDTSSLLPTWTVEDYQEKVFQNETPLESRKGGVVLVSPNTERAETLKVAVAACQKILNAWAFFGMTPVSETASETATTFSKLHLYSPYDFYEGVNQRTAIQRVDTLKVSPGSPEAALGSIVDVIDWISTNLQKKDYLLRAHDSWTISEVHRYDPETVIQRLQYVDRAEYSDLHLAVLMNATGEEHRGQMLQVANRALDRIEMKPQQDLWDTVNQILLMRLLDLEQKAESLENQIAEDFVFRKPSESLLNPLNENNFDEIFQNDRVPGTRKPVLVIYHEDDKASIGLSYIADYLQRLYAPWIDIRSYYAANALYARSQWLKRTRSVPMAVLYAPFDMRVEPPGPGEMKEIDRWSGGPVNGAELIWYLNRIRLWLESNLVRSDIVYRANGSAWPEAYPIDNITISMKKLSPEPIAKVLENKTVNARNTQALMYFYKFANDNTMTTKKSWMLANLYENSSYKSPWDYFFLAEAYRNKGESESAVEAELNSVHEFDTFFKTLELPYEIQREDFSKFIQQTELSPDSKTPIVLLFYKEDNQETRGIGLALSGTKKIFSSCVKFYSYRVTSQVEEMQLKKNMAKLPALFLLSPYSHDSDTPETGIMRRLDVWAGGASTGEDVVKHMKEQINWLARNLLLSNDKPYLAEGSLWPVEK